MTSSAPDPSGPATAAVVLVLALFWSVASWHTAAADKDFHCHWAFARLAWGAPAMAYDSAALRRASFPPPSHHCEALYPPVFALLYGPLAALPLPAAAVVVDLASLALACLSAWFISRLTLGHLGFWRILGLSLVFPATYYDLALGQNALLSLAILSGGWLALARGRLMTSGIAISLLLYKPQWLMAVAWMPAALGLWRFYAGLLVGGGVSVGLSLLLLRPALWSVWLPMMAERLAATGERPEILPLSWDIRNATTYVVGGLLGGVLGWLGLAALIGFTLRGLHRLSRGDRTSPAAAALLMAALVGSPHGLHYDALLLLLPALMLLARAEAGRPRIAVGVALAALYVAIPLMTFAAGRAAWPRLPLVTMAALVLVVLGLRAWPRNP